MFTVKKLFLPGNNRPYSIAAFILFAVFLIYYMLILYLRIGTDAQVHAEMALQFFNAEGNITPNFLYYLLVGMLAGFSKYKVAYYISSVFLLSAAIALKFLVNVFYLKRFTALPSAFIIVPAIMLLFVFSLPGVDFFRFKEFYLGQLAPNVWHNSTVIFLAPFSIILFFETVDFLNRKDTSVTRGIFIFLAILLNAAIKPSFLFTIIPVAILFSVPRFFTSGIKGVFFLLPYLAGLVFIALEYFLIYKLNTSQTVLSAKETSTVIISPFEMWSHFSVNMPVSFITSCFFPLACIVYTKGSILKDRAVAIASVNFLFAILIWILFIETGFRRYHGNFYWQLVIANYLLFFTMLTFLLKQVKNGTINLKGKKMLLALFTVHFGWGIIYWIKIIWFHGYS